MASNYSHLPYNPETLKRELKKYYISASPEEIQQMMEKVGVQNLDQLFSSLPEEVMFKKAPDAGEELNYSQLIDHVEAMAAKNNIKPSFIGDGLKAYKVPEIVPYVCSIRGLTTAYTPYQPERSQGTLMTLWLYSSSMSMLTGFEAINASLYERSTCLSEAIQTSLRLRPQANTVLVSEGIYPGDIEVLKTYAMETKTELLFVPLDAKNGLVDYQKMQEILKEKGAQIAAMAFPQTNSLGLCEDVNALTDLCHQNNILSIAMIDPMLLGASGLKAPVAYGEKGADIIVGEGQHLCLAPNFGGPGLGVFGIRYNDENKLSIRSTAGRYVGLGMDEKGERALSMVLSTREQHIRREKATSNICSNQSFVATIAGAALLSRGDSGMKESLDLSRKRALNVAEKIQTTQELELAFPETSFFNELIVKVNKGSATEWIEKARVAGLHLGVDASKRVQGLEQALLITLTDWQSEEDMQKLFSFIDQSTTTLSQPRDFQKQIPQDLLRDQNPGLPKIELNELKAYYDTLGELNLSPDDNVYPLGSCTMKYNPYINDYAASLSGFTDIHPQAPIEDAQGSLEILYQTQEIFKAVTGLAGLTTQPVAGAQGELVGIKLFQAYHRNNGQAQTRNVILIPTSAHGTNPATATMAGFETKKVDGVQYGIVAINANEKGQMDFEQLQELVKTYNTRIAGIMVTNPNTSGIFENDFKKMAELIHSVDGLVYMDGANMNAIASWVDLGAMGVDAVHNNLHKTWTIPHGGGGPGDAIVAVSEKLLDFLPGHQVVKKDGLYRFEKAPKSIGSFHRHHGNFAHKVRCYTYLKALGSEGIRQMAAVAVLSANYVLAQLKDLYPGLPEKANDVARMHEFILTLNKDQFDRIQKAGTPKAQTIAKIGKLFLDFGMHAPTVAFPEVYGMMIEPTESFTKKELDRFVEVVRAIHLLINEHPEVLTTAPHFTPIRKVNEVEANKNLVLFEKLQGLPVMAQNPINPEELNKLAVGDICAKIVEAHRNS